MEVMMAEVMRARLFRNPPFEWILVRKSPEVMVVVAMERRMEGAEREEAMQLAGKDGVAAVMASRARHRHTT